ncbi:MAG TPA: gamma-aminobutyraldehyde dehydrogenase [Chloroflexota bacterium]|jgi:1-pyrroline dehydrogenase|nr:gamma-aminobutyraldehyde dehydrogenase [Chloroflexota bacterium]
MTTAIVSKQMYVGGQWIDSSGGQTQPILNPATGDVVAHVQRGTAEDVQRAVSAARAAFDGDWSETTPAERSLMLWKLAQALEDHAEDFITLESLNVGKPREVSEGDFEVILDNVRFFAGAARNLEGRASAEYMRGYTSMIRREPVGVVVSIAPWNYPLMMAVWKVGPALAAGNTVVLKPSELTPLTALRMAELAADIFPPGVLNVITGDGEPVGAGLVRHPDVNMVSLTGDVSTGKEIARAASQTLKRVHLELGGKAPVVIFDDADFEAVAEAVKIAGFWNSGQDCTAATRLLVPDRVYDDLLSVLKPAVESLTVGDPTGEVDMGPVISNDQLERVSGFVDRARDSGATVISGGARDGDRGFFYRPSIVGDVGQDAEIVQREVFGPVITVQRFAGDDEAIAWANDVPYGLAASVWTSNVSRALNAARRLKFGTVWINDHIPLVSEMPHGGFKQSGYGKDLSPYGIEDYTQIKHVMAKFA